MFKQIKLTLIHPSLCALVTLGMTGVRGPPRGARCAATSVKRTWAPHGKGYPYRKVHAPKVRHRQACGCDEFPTSGPRLPPPPLPPSLLGCRNYPPTPFLSVSLPFLTQALPPQVAVLKDEMHTKTSLDFLARCHPGLNNVV